MFLTRGQASAALGRHEEAVADFTEVLRLDPQSRRAPYFKMASQLLLDRWDAAASDLALLLKVENSRDEAEALFLEAGLCLGRDDREGYRQKRDHLLRQAEQGTPLTANLAARASALAADAETDLALALRLAERAVQAERNAWYLHTVALVHYRAGRPEQARQLLQESLTAGPKWTGSTLNWLLLALAHHRLGQTDEARRRLTKALPVAVPAMHAHDALEYQLLRREATAVFR
jgi:tetratricopeptide (TPR) repeat protein